MQAFSYSRIRSVIKCFTCLCQIQHFSTASPLLARAGNTRRIYESILLNIYILFIIIIQVLLQSYDPPAA